MKMWVLDYAGNKVYDTDILMKEAGLNPGMGFEDVGIQGDGTPVIFDRCGGFGYLNSNKYRVVIDILAE